LPGDHAEMGAKRVPDPLRRRPVGHAIERGVKRASALPCDLPEQVFLRVDVVVERRLLHAELVRQIGERRALVALLGEEARRDPG
jgi:hypothetical protein